MHPPFLKRHNLHPRSPMPEKVKRNVGGYLWILTKLSEQEILHHLTCLNFNPQLLTTIIYVASDPYAVSVSTHTFLRSCHITLTIFRTTNKHSDFPAAIALNTYNIVTKSSWNASIYAAKCDQKKPYLPNSSLAIKLPSM